MILTALIWSFVNFGLLLWLPMDLQARGYSPGLASGILASSALPALIAASRKFGEIAAQVAAFAGYIPTLGGAALVLLAPTALSAIAIYWVGRETAGHSLGEIT